LPDCQMIGTLWELTKNILENDTSLGKEIEKLKKTKHLPEDDSFDHNSVSKEKIFFSRMGTWPKRSTWLHPTSFFFFFLHPTSFRGMLGHGIIMSSDLVNRLTL
jgi:hypothetical protein